MPGGLLNMRQGGLLGGGYNPIRQIATGGTPGQQGAGWMAAEGMGDPNQYGSDAWAQSTGGPGAMIFREMARYMAGNKKAPLGFLDPNEKAFSSWLRPYLGPQYQKKSNK